MLAIVASLVGCAEQKDTPTTVSFATIAPTALTNQGTTIALATITPTSAPTATAPVSLTFSTYRDPRGVFALDVPSNWRTEALKNGIGISSFAYNASVVVTISFSWQATQLDSTKAAEIVEMVKSQTFATYLTRDVQLNSASEGATYRLEGTATLNAQPMYVRFELSQTTGGSIMLQSWLVPQELWPEVETTFYKPMQQSLSIDDEAAAALAQE
ncbi:hypothetical protein SE18_03925 [Herpetosiphon geysericola]|uniref:Uncharacterized protein n=1 Tax=Herpetosiphon geysericola TaxID=70996 RepID=A0A0P6Y4D7_9CHLR|nr:hypothetical protein SE18_03925 [Herpetosiphon geysericola]